MLNIQQLVKVSVHVLSNKNNKIFNGLATSSSATFLGSSFKQPIGFKSARAMYNGCQSWLFQSLHVNLTPHVSQRAVLTFLHELLDFSLYCTLETETWLLIEGVGALPERKQVAAPAYNLLCNMSRYHSFQSTCPPICLLDQSWHIWGLSCQNPYRFRDPQINKSEGQVLNSPNATRAVLLLHAEGLLRPQNAF